MLSLDKSGRRWLAPEVVQTSAMDCGPASLKCLLEGFGVRVSYDRLREACQTDVDGTSIDTLEEVANALGLQAEQVMLPRDHVLAPEANALPALVVVRLPNGNTHFTVAWSRAARLVQLMDPGVGRLWLPERRFLDELYVHSMPVPAEEWREWAGSEDFLRVLARRMAAVGTSASRRQVLQARAQEDPSWRLLAALDAATRMTAALVGSGTIRRGTQSAAILHALVQKDDLASLVPAPYWSVGPAPASDDGTERLLLRGAVLLRALGRRRPAARDGKGAGAPTGATEPPPPLSAELRAALEEPRLSPTRELFRMLLADGLLRPAVIGAGMLVAAMAAVAEALLLRGLVDIGGLIGLRTQRLSFLGVTIVFLAALMLVELGLSSGLLNAGRALEARLRLAFLRKLPRLYDRYFQSRLSSDMAQRCHNVHAIRGAPLLGGQVLRTAFELAATTAGIAWLDPPSVPLAVLTALLALALPMSVHPALSASEMKVRTHAGALSRFYLDALLGLVPIRSHGAERAVREEHESLLLEWARGGLRLLRTASMAEALAAGAGFALTGWLLWRHLTSSEGQSGAVLLVAYWALQLPVLGQELALLARQYPAQRNALLRLLEPLGAQEAPEPIRAHAAKEGSPGVAIAMRGVSVRVSGHVILQDVELSIRPGEHVAIVGPSGAGKSTFVGLLLGWHRPAEGSVEVDGDPLDASRLDWLRQQTVWVDPAVHLWNRSLLANLLYGSPCTDARAIAPALDAAHLHGVLERLPEGLATRLGEGGALVSGGEGQRVRLGRALVRPGARLVLLDEPLRGIDREQRRQLLRAARARSRNATLLCVTHDIGETLSFPRVIVIDEGRIVQDGTPQELERAKSSRYRTLLDAEDAVRNAFRTSTTWRRLRLEGGVLVELGGTEATRPNGEIADA